MFGLGFLLIATLWLAGLPVAESLRLMAAGAFGDKFGLSRTLVKATPLALVSLGILVAWRAGMFNIGGEGQFIAGGVNGAFAAKLFEGSPALQLTIILFAIIAGAALGSIAGWLKVKRGVDVVISTILLNFIAVQVLGYTVDGPLRERNGGLPISDQLPNAVMFHRFDAQTDLHSGVFIALLLSIAMWWFLFRTRPGFLLRVVGDSPSVARTNRFSEGKFQVLAMAISGGLAGLAGAVEYLGINGQIGTDFSQNWGFMAIPVALLGGLHPIGVVVSALFFGALLAGSTQLSRFSTGGDTLIFIVQATAVLAFVGAQAWLRRRSSLAPSIPDQEVGGK